MKNENIFFSLKKEYPGGTIDMQTTIYHCDICGEEKEEEEFTRYFKKDNITKIESIKMYYSKLKNYEVTDLDDICEDCNKKLLNLFSKKAKERIKEY